MRITGIVHQLEASSAHVVIADDGRAAVISFLVGPDHYRVALDRHLLDRMALQISREQARVPKRARRRPSGNESI